MPKYDAFISYRHTEPDKTIAEKLHKMLETYKVPSKIAKKTGKKKINRVFRDKEELPTSSNLAASIEDALINSEYLIVICSPRTPESKWVLKEIETFSKLHGHDKILALLIEGEPIDAFPEQLRFVTKEMIDNEGNVIEEKEEVEPLAADIRGKDTKELIKNLKKELLRLLAPILGCNFDDLRQRHRERFIKRVITISICFSLFFLAFGSFSTWQAIQIKQQVNKTLEGQSLYLANLSRQVLNEGDRRTAILLALEALPKNLEKPERPYVEEAEYALTEGLNIYNTSNTFMSDIVLNHRKSVSNIQISPDHSKVFTVCNDGKIYLWDTSNGNLLYTFPHNSITLSKEQSSFSANGEIIVSITSDGLAAWSTTTGVKLWEIEATIPRFVLNPDGKSLALIQQEPTKNHLKLIDINNGNVFIHMTFERKNFELVNAMAFNQDGSILALGTDQGLIQLVDIQNQKNLYRLNSANENIKKVFFSDDGKKIAAFSGNFDLETADIYSTGTGNIEIWDTESTQNILNHKLNTSTIAEASFSPVNSNIVAYTENELVKVVDISSGEILFTFTHGSKVTNFKIFNDGDFFVTTSLDGNIMFYSLDIGISLPSWNIYHNDSISVMDIEGNILALSASTSNKAYLLKSLDNPYVTTMSGHSSTIEKGKFSPSGQKVLTVAESEVFIWDIEKRSLFNKLNGIEGTILNADFTPDESKISILTKEGYIKIFDMSSGSELSSLNTGSFTNYYYSPSNSLVALQIDDMVKIFDCYNCKELLTINNNSYLNKSFFSNQDKFVLIGKWDGEFSLYDIKTAKILHTFQNKENLKINVIAFNKDDSLLALNQGDRIYIYDTKNFEMVGYIENLLFAPSVITFSHDNRELFVGLDDKSIQIYDLETGQYKTELTGHNQILKECRYSPDGNLLITIGEFGECILWNPVNYKKLAYINKVLDINHSFTNFLSFNYQDVILMPRYDLESLVRIAKSELGNRKLSKEEKIKYYIIE